ncbi:MAG: RibD family protein [Cyanobacteriota bacterium]|nr:RibD family protein [Cyanobacteriota bacterium]
MNRPHTTVVLAMSADGKIADRARSAARFASRRDRAHLERQVARADGVLFGAQTLRAYGTSLPLSDPQLLQQRQQSGQPLQPVHLVCSRSGRFDPGLRFFRQNVPRWLLVPPQGAQCPGTTALFDRILVVPLLPPPPARQEGAISSSPPSFDWEVALERLKRLGFDRLAILGGGELVASLFAVDLVDEVWLTICPLILGGVTAPTPVEGLGFPAERARRLQLVSVTPVEDELFVRYRVSQLSPRMSGEGTI